MRDIKGYSGIYKACESGQIHSSWSTKLPKGRYLKPWLIGHGYEMVMLYKDGKPKKFLTHRLIAEAFIPNPNNLPEVNHKDGNRRNNRYENLEWVTSKENKQHAIKLGRYKNTGKGASGVSPLKGIPRKRINPKTVKFIREQHKGGKSMMSLTKKLDLSYSTIFKTVHHMSHKNVI